MGVWSPYGCQSGAPTTSLPPGLQGSCQAQQRQKWRNARQASKHEPSIRKDTVHNNATSPFGPERRIPALTRRSILHHSRVSLTHLLKHVYLCSQPVVWAPLSHLKFVQTALERTTMIPTCSYVSTSHHAKQNAVVLTAGSSPDKDPHCDQRSHGNRIRPHECERRSSTHLRYATLQTGCDVQRSRNMLPEGLQKEGYRCCASFD